MYAFTVKAMICGGCANAITRAIYAADQLALVRVQLDSKRVEVDTNFSQTELLKVFDEAGYPAEPVTE